MDETAWMLLLRGRLLEYEALPTRRAWENVSFTPTSGQPYIADAFIPATSTLWTFPADGGQVEDTGLYRITWFGLTGSGHSAIRDPMAAIRALFAPGTPLGVTDDGAALRVLTNPGPTTGQLLRIEGGWTALSLTIPWAARYTNAVVTP